MRGRPREFERDDALDKAMRLFWSRGYEATGVAALCESMGVGRQSLYNAFGDKEALFTEALARYREVRLKPLIDGLRESESGLEAVLEVLDVWEKTSSEVAAKGCLMANSIAELGMREPRLSAELGKMLGEMEAAFRGALERAREAGELPDGRDPTVLARLLTTIGQGLSTVGKLDPTGAFQRDAVRSVRALLQ